MCVLIESEKLKNNRPVTMHSLIRLCLNPLFQGEKGGQSFRMYACGLGVLVAFAIFLFFYFNLDNIISVRQTFITFSALQSSCQLMNIQNLLDSS